MIAVAPDPHRRAMAARVARGARVPIDVVSGVAEALPIADDTIDAAVSSLVLCSVSDVVSFLAPVRDGAELPEWIRPAARDGRLGLFAVNSHAGHKSNYSTTKASVSIRAEGRLSGHLAECFLFSGAPARVPSPICSALPGQHPGA